MQESGEVDEGEGEGDDHGRGDDQRKLLEEDHLASVQEDSTTKGGQCTTEDTHTHCTQRIGGIKMIIDDAVDSYRCHHDKLRYEQ